jgi:hypothetical protein
MKSDLKKKKQHLRNNLVILFIDSFVFLLPVILNHLAFQSFDFNVISKTGNGILSLKEV